MSDAVIVAIITGIVTIVATVITVRAGMQKQAQQAAIQQAVTDTKIEELTREVRMHNEFATRIPLLEARIESLERTK